MTRLLENAAEDLKAVAANWQSTFGPGRNRWPMALYFIRADGTVKTQTVPSEVMANPEMQKTMQFNAANYLQASPEFVAFAAVGESWVIDFSGMSEADARKAADEVLQLGFDNHPARKEMLHMTLLSSTRGLVYRAPIIRRNSDGVKMLEDWEIVIGGEHEFYLQEMKSAWRDVIRVLQSRN